MEKRLRNGVMAIVVISILLLVIFSAYSIFVRPISASPSSIILNEGDLEDWSVSDRRDGYGGPPTMSHYTYTTFFKEIHGIEYYVLIIVTSYSSSGSAHNEYLDVSSERVANVTALRLGEEGVYSISRGYIPDPINGTIEVDHELVRIISENHAYYFREGNIIAYMEITAVGQSLDPNRTYFEPWMDQIAQLQIDKVHRNNIISFEMTPHQVKPNDRWQ